MEFSQSQFLKFDGSQVTLEVKNVADAKKALQEVKLLKKRLALRKKELMNRKRERRAAYTHTSRTQGPIVRGRSGLASFLRFAQNLGRWSNRAKLASELAPADEEIQLLERHMLGFDNLIIQIESFIMQSSR